MPKITKVPVSKSVLRWALERSERPSTVRRKFPKLSEWETGQSQPTLRQLEKLAKETAASFGYMFSVFGKTVKNLLFDDYIRRHRRAEELLKLQESKTLEFKSTLRWNPKEDRKDDKIVAHSVLKTIAAFRNTEGGDLLIGVADDKKVLGIGHDRLGSDDKFMLHLSQVVRNGLGERTSTCIDPTSQIVEGKTVSVVSCQRSP